MSDALRFEEIRVLRMPGFRAGGFPLTQLSPGINVIHGPNGSGKTTSAHAIEALLWPRSAVALRPHVSGRFRLGSDEWSVDVEYDRAVHQRNGITTDPPPIPPAEERDRYRLSLHELIGAEDVGYAESILKEAAGGYDLASARESLPSPSPLSVRSREHRELRAATAELEAAVAAQRALREDERGLSDLARRREAAMGAARLTEVLRLAITHAEALEMHERAVAGLSAFPEGMARLRGDEWDRISEVEQELASLDAAIATARTRMANALGEIETAGLGEALVDPALIAGLRSDLETLRELERGLADHARARDAAHRLAEDARRSLGPGADEGTLAAIDLEALGNLTDLASRAAQGRLRAAALRDRIVVLGGGPEANDAENGTRGGTSGIARAEACLRGWLRAPEPVALADGATRTAAVAAGAVLIAAGLGLASASVLWLLLALAGAAVLVVALRGPRPSADARAHHRMEYEKLPFDPPAAWEPAAVEARLEELQDVRSAAHLAAERASARQGLEVELARAERELEEIEAERRASATGLLAPSDTDPAALVWLAHRIAQWQTARSEAAAAREAAATAAGQLDATRAALRSRLARFADEPLETTGDFAGAIQRLDRRRERRDGALREHADASGAIRELTARAGRCREAATELYDRCGVAAGDAAALARIGDSFPEYRSARKAMDEAEFALAHAARSLDAADPPPALRGETPGELRARLRAAEEGAAPLPDINERITLIGGRIEDAKKLHAIEACQERVERCRAALADARERETRGVIASLLADRVREATETDHLPAVFHRAQKIFTGITRGRYSLAFASAPEPRFHAFDNQERRGRSIEELSSGTRVQLLLAVRVAFVETQEARARLPLVLDEVLGNSDDERAAAIIDAVVELARDGRQIFYLTAQHDEVAKWRAVLEREAGVDWRLIDLVAARSGQRPLQTEKLRAALPRAAAIPNPRGASHDDYAEALGVPGLDPVSAHAGNLHLWYLVDTPDRLHDLLIRGVTCWGQMEALARSAPGVVADERELARTAALAVAAEAWIESRRVGAGTPVDREALVKAEAVSDVFLDRAADLSERVGGDARRLIGAIEAGELKRFRNAAQLREYFEAEGYLDPRDPIPEAAIRVRVIGSVAAEIERGDLTLTEVDALIARLAAGAATV